MRTLICLHQKYFPWQHIIGPSAELTISSPTRSTPKGFHLHWGSHCCYNTQGEKALDPPWQNTRVSCLTPFRGITIHPENSNGNCVILQKGTSRRIQGIQTSLDLPRECLAMPAGANNKWRSLFSCKGQDNCIVCGVISLFESSASRNFSFL